MDAKKPIPGAPYSIERFAPALAAVGCIVITIAIWRSISTYQDMWPLPGLYFLELPAVSIAAALACNLGIPRASVLTWGALGIVVAFCILGAFSVGMLYLPVALLLAVAAISSDVRHQRPVTVHLAVCLVAAMAQAALMLLAIRLLYPTAVFQA